MIISSTNVNEGLERKLENRLRNSHYSVVHPKELLYNIAMAIKSLDDRPAGIEIDLSGPQGNAFVLLGTAKSLARQLNYSKEEIENLMAKMQESDYNNLVEVFDEHFGTFVTLYKP